MIRKYILPVLAIIGVGVAVFMVMQGNRTRPVAPARGPVSEGAIYFVHLRSRHRGGQHGKHCHWHTSFRNRDSGIREMGRPSEHGRSPLQS